MVPDVAGFRFRTGRPPTAGIEISGEAPLLRVVGGVRVNSGTTFEGVGEVVVSATRLFVVGTQGKAGGRFLDDVKTQQLMVVVADLAAVAMIGVREHKKALGGKVGRAAAIAIRDGNTNSVVEIEPVGEVLKTLIANLRDPMPKFQHLAELVAARRGCALPPWQRESGGPFVEFEATT